VTIRSESSIVDLKTVKAMSKNVLSSDRKETFLLLSVTLVFYLLHVTLQFSSSDISRTFTVKRSRNSPVKSCTVRFIIIF